MQTIAADPDVLAEQLRAGVTRTARRLRQEADAGLTPTLQATLATVERHGPLTPSDIAMRERIKRPTATRMIAVLEEQGLVERTPDPDDGRCSLISVTAAGRAHLRRVRDRKDVFLARRLRALSAAERETLARASVLLERMLDEDPA